MEDNERSESRCIAKEPCPKCGSADNLARYDDGHAHCFTPKCGYWEPATNEAKRTFTPVKRDTRLIEVTIPDDGLSSRKLTHETLRKFGYGIGTYVWFTGEGEKRDRHEAPCQVAPIRNVAGDTEVAQKIRMAGKEFRVSGDLSDAGLFGQHLCREGGKRIVITEGEIDAMSVSQAMGNNWPAVSIVSGAGNAAKDIKRNLEFLSSYETIVLMFDNDDAGRAAVDEVASLFPPGKVVIATLPMKDASDMLQAGLGRQIVSASWEARKYRPGGIVTLKDVRARVLEPVKPGLPWCFPEMNVKTYGRRMGEAAGWAAGVGCGKTDFFMQQIAFDVTELNEKVGLFLLEQQPGGPDGTGRRLVGKVKGKLYHIPDQGWTEEEFTRDYDELSERDAVFIHDHFGSADWADIQSRMRFLYHNEGVRLFYLDNLTALSDKAKDERRSLDGLMAEMGGLVKEIPIHLSFVSHLTTPQTGQPHEEGGRVYANQFTGSRALMRWAHFLFGIERNTKAEDEEKLVARIRCLKDRYTGFADGEVWTRKYDRSTGILRPYTPAPQFKDETGGGDGAPTSF